MVTDLKVTINALIVVLFLTMVIFDRTFLNIAYFVILFWYLWKLEWFDT